MLVIEGERLVIVVDLGQIGVAEDLGENRQTPALLGDDLAIGLALPAAAPALLVLPILGIADAWLGLDIVEPGIFHTLAGGPHVLAGDEQVWQPMHLSRFITIAICARIFMRRSP